MTVSTPVSAQAASSHHGLLINRAMSAETMKIPDPIMVPITIMVESNRFRPRTNPEVSMPEVWLMKSEQL